MSTKINTKISLKIDNLIQGYCYNFLSYLYKERGWKRAVFETCKENIIDSDIEDEKIRIVITSDGKIMLTCYCIFDVIKSMEFIISEFKYGRMGYYIVMDETTGIDVTFNSTYYLKDYIFEKEETSETEFGSIKLFKKEATLIYNDWEDGEILKEILISAIEEEDEEEIKTKDEEKKPMIDINNEKIIMTVLFLWSMVRLSELL